MEKQPNKKEPRIHRFNIALTKSERDLFRNASIARGTSISTLLRQSAIRSIKLEEQIFQNN
jgi:hypothetical protein